MKPVLRQPATAGAGTQAVRSLASERWRAILPLALLICVGTRCAMAQGVAESNQTPAVTPSEDIEAANRKALENQAGKNAAKLMLRSAPDKSSVLVNGKPVGKTPLLLIVPPGVYAVEMERSPRAEYGRQQVDLLPKEAREVMLDLQPRYPAYLRLSLASSR